MRIQAGVKPIPDEPCDAAVAELHDAGLEPHPSLVEDGDGRLRARLLARASPAHPLETLREAALFSLEASGALSRSVEIPEVHAHALADLSGSGRRSFIALQAALARASREQLTAELQAMVHASARGRTSAPIDMSYIASTCSALIARTWDVCWALRGEPERRPALRERLGYIACSSEHDVPDRPVNTPSARWPQYDVALTVGEQDLTVRLVVCAADAPRALRDASQTLPTSERPQIPPDAELMLFIHGHSSRAEEGNGLIEALLSASAARGQALAILAFDLPCNGYSSTFDHTEVAASHESRYFYDAPERSRFPLLDFYDACIVQVVAELDRQQAESGLPLVSARMQAALGGSLGGNLVLRLAARRDIAWPSTAIAWSAASVWPSWGRASLQPVRALLDPQCEFDPIRKIVYERTRKRMDAVELPRSRAQHIARQFEGEELIDGLDSTRWITAQSDHWYRPGWGPCAARAIEAGRRSISELYSARRRRWHWRVAHEQLGFSHLDNIVREAQYATVRFPRPLLLLAGTLDNDQLSICDNTRKLARWLSDSPGEALLVEDTGHSIHAERPRFLAARILDFLARYPTV